MRILLALITSIFLISPVFAETQGQTMVQPIVDGVNARTATLAKTEIFSSSCGGKSQTTSDSDIIVINYPYNFPIITVFPSGAVPVQGSTSVRYRRTNYTGFTFLELRNGNNVPFWSGYVQFLDTVSVYIDGRTNQYVVYVTHNN